MRNRIRRSSAGEMVRDQGPKATDTLIKAEVDIDGIRAVGTMGPVFIMGAGDSSCHRKAEPGSRGKLRGIRIPGETIESVKDPTKER